MWVLYSRMVKLEFGGKPENPEKAAVEEPGTTNLAYMTLPHWWGVS